MMVSVFGSLMERVMKVCIVYFIFFERRELS
jgi:hypothetical protein